MGCLHRRRSGKGGSATTPSPHLTPLGADRRAPSPATSGVRLMSCWRNGPALWTARHEVKASSSFRAPPATFAASRCPVRHAIGGHAPGWLTRRQPYGPRLLLPEDLQSLALPASMGNFQVSRWAGHGQSGVGLAGPRKELAPTGSPTGVSVPLRTSGDGPGACGHAVGSGFANQRRRGGCDGVLVLTAPRRGAEGALYQAPRGGWHAAHPSA